MKIQRGTKANILCMLVPPYWRINRKNIDGFKIKYFFWHGHRVHTKEKRTRTKKKEKLRCTQKYKRKEKIEREYSVHTCPPILKDKHQKQFYLNAIMHCNAWPNFTILHIFLIWEIGKENIEGFFPSKLGCDRYLRSWHKVVHLNQPIYWLNIGFSDSSRLKLKFSS